MPAARSTRRSTTGAAAQVEEQEGAYNVPHLNFNEPLSWRAGRAISVADLFTRLQKLSTELRTVEQGAIEVKDIAKLAQDLVNANLLGHKDKGIRAWTVTCVVDILNICAPNAPYRPGQLKDIFTVIISTILPALADPTNAYNAQHQYILDQLVDTQSIVLITDVPEPDQLLSQLFTTCFDVVSGSGKNASGMDLAQSVVFQLGVLLNTVVDEANLPQDVVDIVISQFLRVDPRTNPAPAPKKKASDTKDKSQTTLILKDYPPAYNLAKNVCTTSSEKMSASISQYFNSIITNASASLTDDDDKMRPLKRAGSADSDSDDDDRDSLNDLRKAHRLVKELWRACPDVLTNVIPQLEVELAADSISLRQLAVETIGDLVAGIGIAGLPDLPLLDPAVYPSPTITSTSDLTFSDNPLLKPSSPKPFIHVHASTYEAFLGRRIDKVMVVRRAWASSAARILLTNAGGIGLHKDEQAFLLSSYAKLLRDVDEKVRLTALDSLEVFPYSAVVDVLGSDGGLADSTSVLSTVAERVTDRRTLVREKAMFLLASMWGVASGDIARNEDQVTAILGPAPTKLLLAMYAKDAHIAITLPRVLYECLLPIYWPPSKGKTQTSGEDDASSSLDEQRAKRLLALVRALDEKAKTVYYGMQKRQADMAKAISGFLAACEAFNGGVLDDSNDEARLEAHVKQYIDPLSRQFPEPSKAASDLWKFARTHDRRNYQLIRFAIGAEYDYKTMTKAIKELNKRLKETGSGMGPVFDTLMTLLYQSALISYNRSHIPAIMALARSQDAGFAEAAQDILREISARVPEVMRTHIQDLCKELQDSSPSEAKAETSAAEDSLKACAAFARRFPDDVPQDKKFIVALQNFALYSTSPKAAKYATNIILATSNKKELRAKEILSKAIKRYNSSAENKLAQLSTIAQVCLHSPHAADVEHAKIGDIAITSNLMIITHPQHGEHDESAWTDEPDHETSAKLLALKILVNRCRSGGDDPTAFHALAQPVVDILMQLIRNKGNLKVSDETPSAQRNHLRLAAARSLVKLCRYKRLVEDLVTPAMFQEVAWMLIHRPHGVRKGLTTSIKKYLNTNKLNVRWITTLFLLAFEPDDELRNSTSAWLKSKTTYYTNQAKQVRSSSDKKTPVQNVMETAFARLLSLLAHHPDYPAKGDPNHDADLLDFARNIIFYLQSCANEENLSLIFHIAQRVKQAADAVSGSDDVDDRLYVLSDLAQATIRNYADQLPASAKGVNLLQTWPGKAQLPSSLFKPINGHDKAQKIAARNYLPEDVATELERVVKKALRQSKQGAGAKAKTSVATDKKRKSSVSFDVDDVEVASVRKSVKKSKQNRSSELPIRKTPNAKKRKSEAPMSAEQPSRKSARTTSAKKVSYEESDDDEEEEGSDEENIVKYKATPVQQTKDKSKSKGARSATRESDDALDTTADQAGTPTPQQQTAESIDGENESNEEHDEEEQSVEEQDTAMTNGHSENAGNDEEEDEQHDSEMAEDDEEVEETTKTPRRADTRTRRSKATPISVSKTTKAKTPASAKGAERSASKKRSSTRQSDATSKPEKHSRQDQGSSVATPPAEATRRSTRRAKT